MLVVGGGQHIFVVVAETLERESRAWNCASQFGSVLFSAMAVHSILSEFGKICLLFSFEERQ